MQESVARFQALLASREPPPEARDAPPAQGEALRQAQADAGPPSGDSLAMGEHPAARLLALLDGGAPAAPQAAPPEAPPAAQPRAEQEPQASPPARQEEAPSPEREAAIPAPVREDERAIATPTETPRVETLLTFLDGPRPTEAPAAAAPPRAAELAELVGTLADRVLVGQRADGTAEIRVTLKGEALGATEVTIARSGGALELRFEPQTESAAALLRDHGESLARGLSDRLESRVVIAVADARDARGGHGDGQREGRSRGFEDIVTYAAGRA
jgi:hypothetical protein